MFFFVIYEGKSLRKNESGWYACLYERLPRARDREVGQICLGQTGEYHVGLQLLQPEQRERGKSLPYERHFHLFYSRSKMAERAKAVRTLQATPVRIRSETTHEIQMHRHVFDS